VLLVLSIASMVFGNLAALVQTDIKRLLAYSTIAHAGYMLIGLLTFTRTGVAAAVFYAIIYVPVAFCPFLVVTVVGRDGRNPSMSSLAGLYHRSPLLMLVLIAGLFGLAGIPPTPGFAGKWFLFSAAAHEGYWWLVLIAAIAATVSIYYYLIAMKAAFLVPAEGAPPIRLSFAVELACVLALGLILFIGFYPGPLWDLCMRAATALFVG